jgi:signal transduction histidine kinase
MMLGHLPQLLADAEAREALSGRADDAIERVDELLQNVIAYARLGAPAREPVAVAPLLDRLLGEVEPELEARSIRVRRTGSEDVTCLGDPAQLEYGFRNLLAGVVREVPPRDEFAIDTAQNGVVAVQFAAREAAVARLRAMVATDGAPDLGDPTLLPLPFTLARAVIERNGGSLDVREDERGPTTLVVTLPTTTTD